MLNWQKRNIDWLKIAIVAAIGLCCLWSPLSLAQKTEGLKESGIAPKAMRMYLQAVRELHRGNAVAAENDANLALRLDAKFADAGALAATAALAQRKFDRARREASEGCGSIPQTRRHGSRWLPPTTILANIRKRSTRCIA